MLETIVFIILGSIFISVFVWFYLCNKLYGLLSREHPETYEAIGKPSLIMNNSIENGILFMKFIFKKEWRELNDNKLTALCEKMFIFAVIYFVMFAALPLLVTYGILTGNVS